MKLLSFGCIGLLLVVLSFAGYGCGSKSAKDYNPESGQPAMKADGEPELKVQQAGLNGPAGQPLGAGKQPAADIERKIVYTADLRLVVEDLDKTHKDLTALIKKHEGYVEESDVQGKAGSSRSSVWKVRIPIKAFDDFRDAVLDLGEPEKNSIQSKDVTDQYYDTQARIANKEEVVKKLKELLDKAAKDIKEVMIVRDKLDPLQEEIDALKGKLKLLQNLTGMTTVNITFLERKGYVPPQAASFGTTVARTFEGSVAALLNFGQGLVLFAVALAPWLPVFALLAGVVWWLVRIAQRHGKAPPPVSVRTLPATPPPAGHA